MLILTATGKQQFGEKGVNLLPEGQIESHIGRNQYFIRNNKFHLQ